MVIKVQLKDERTGREQAFEFNQSPIRVGRNALNNIVIDDGFVSQWHGMIRFDDVVVSYADLGSTNGTELEGRRLPKDVAVPLRGTAQLKVSGFRLIVTASLTSATAPSVPADVATKLIPWGAVPPDALPAAAPSARGDPDRLARCLRILEGFSEAFVALKKGYQEFGAEVGVRPLAGSTPLHRARTGRELMDHLLAPAQEVDACLNDLRAVFADMGIHQIALMEGITQAIRALLESLDPNSQRATAGLFSRGRSKALSASGAQRFASLIAEDAALHAEIFGETFARAYASVALGAAAPSDPAGGAAKW